MENAKTKQNNIIWLGVVIGIIMSVITVLSLLPVKAATVQPPVPSESGQPAHYGVLLESIYDPNYVYAVSYAYNGISLWGDYQTKYFSYSLFDHEYFNVKASYDGGQTYPYTIYLTKPNISNFKVIYGDICPAYAGYDKIYISSDNSIYTTPIQATTINDASYPNKLYFRCAVLEDSNDVVSSYFLTFCFMSKGDIRVDQNFNDYKDFGVWNNTDDSKLYYYDENDNVWKLIVQSNGINTRTYQRTSFDNIKIEYINEFYRGDFIFSHYTAYFNGDLTDTTTGFINNGIHITAVKFANEVEDFVPTPTPSPTPTPDPNMQEYNILVPCTENAFFKNNYMFSFKASGINETYIQPQDDTWNTLKTQFTDITRELQYNAAIFRIGKYGGSWLGGFYGQSAIFYIQVQSYSDIKFYSYSGSVVSDIDVMKTVGTVSDGTITNNDNFKYSSYYIQELDNGGYCIAFVFRDGEYWSPNFNNVISNVWFQKYTIESTNQINNSIPFAQNSTQYSESLKLRLNVENNAVPDPNVPTAAPTPTDLPHVIVVIPTGTPAPSPTAMGNLGNFTLPGDGSGNEQGGNGGDLQAGTTKSIIGAGIDYIRNHISNGLLASAFSYIPSDLQFLIWFLVFMLILLAVIRLIIHFGG